MNKRQKILNYTAGVIADSTWLKLRDDYGLYNGYDYSEVSLFRYCRKLVKKIAKENNYTNDDINNLRGSLYISITSPLCDNIAKAFKEEIEKY